MSTSNGLLGEVCGFDHLPLDNARKDWHEHTFPYKMSQYKKRFLTQPTEVCTLEYQGFDNADTSKHKILHIPFDECGRSDTVVIWVDYQLTPDINLSYLESKAGKTDFKEYLKSGVRFFEQARDVTTSSYLEVEVGFCVGDSDVNLQFKVK